MNLQEWSWVGLAKTISGPLTLRRLMLAATPASLEALGRVKGQVMVTVFGRMDRLLEQAKLGPLDTFKRLAREGFLPAVRASVPSSDRFGFVHDDEWVEWPVASVEVIRVYWTSLLAGVSCKQRTLIEPVLQSWLSLLPGDRACCSRCRWALPASAMYRIELADSVCNFCHSGRDCKLEVRRGNTFMRR